MNCLGRAKIHLELPPCCLKYYPLDNKWLLVGTYKFDEVKNVKYGSIDILKYTAESSTVEYGNTLELVRSIPVNCAVLDLQFSPVDGNLFATAQSNGSVFFWRVENSGEVQVSKISEYPVFENLLITSLKFSETDSKLVIVTSTSGEVSVLSISNSEMATVARFENHSLEAWIGNFGNFGALQNVIFSGGDDTLLVANDLRTQEKVFESRRIHDAGITSILTAGPGDNNGQGSWFANENHFKLLTGSYDDCLKISDLRYMENTMLPYPPKIAESSNLAGGVWRLTPMKKVQKARGQQLLVCCMYDGAKIVTVDPATNDINTNGVFKKNHESMVYGGDTSVDVPVSTCSFYDKVVQVWDPQSEES